MHTLPDLNAMELDMQHSPHVVLHNYMKVIYILYCVNDCMGKNKKQLYAFYAKD